MNYGMLSRELRPVTRQQRSMCEAGAVLHTSRTALSGAQGTLGCHNNNSTICCTQHISVSQKHASHPYQSAFSTILYNGNVTNKSGLLQLQGAVQGIPLGPLTNQIRLLA